MERLRKFFRLPVPERLLLVRAITLLALVRVALWLFPFRIIQLISAKVVQACATSHHGKRLPSERGVWALQAASRYVPHATCLTQALAGQLLIAFNGTSASVRIGVAKTGAKDFEAHAWLESEGKILIGGADADQRYTCLLTFNPWER